MSESGVDPDRLSVVVQHLCKAFKVDGRLVNVLNDISLELREQEFLTIIGPSGCGKSTLLNIICGLLEADAGTILLHGQAESQRLGRIGYMPQRDLLLPWRKMLDNIILGPEVMGRDLQETRRRARELLPLFGLEGFEDSYPHELSGGMRQRAALMRTFLCEQEIVLLDEPLGALDALTRRVMRDWLLDVWERFDQSVIFVTHDVDEGVLLSDRICVLSERPATVVEDVEIALPRPRSEEMIDTELFADYRARILRALGL